MSGSVDEQYVVGARTRDQPITHSTRNEAKAKCMAEERLCSRNAVTQSAAKQRSSVELKEKTIPSSTWRVKRV